MSARPSRGWLARLGVALVGAFRVTSITALPAHADPVSVQIALQTDGVQVAGGQGSFEAYTYSETKKRWNQIAGTSTDQDGIATLFLEPGSYRFCFGVQDASYQRGCHGAPLVFDASTVDLVGPLDLGVANLHKKTVATVSGSLIEGRPVVGQRLRVDLSKMSPDPEFSEIYWVQDGATGAEAGDPPIGVPVGRGQEYLVKASDVGHSISVAVIFFGPDVSGPSTISYFASYYVSKAIGPVLFPAKATGKPKLSARAWRVGKTVSYQAPTNLPAGLTASFQWLRNGRALTGQTNAWHKLGKADRKRKLTLRVTYSAPMHELFTITTQPSPKIR